MIRAGSLRHPVSILKNTPTQNAVGESVDSFAPIASVRASIVGAKGSGEVMIGSQVNARARYVVTMRYFAGLSTEHRLQYGTKTFDINDVNDVEERHRKMVLACSELV